MKVQTKADLPSLIPYLVSQTQGLRLNLDLKEAQAPSGQDTVQFSRIEATGPFSTLLEATICGGDEKSLAELFLLVQPDQYQQISELDPTTNAHVEALWQEAILRASRNDAGGLAATLTAQTDAQGRPVAFSPLFYCRHVKRYARCLCPNCGESLSLCKEDQLLRAAGLPAYSESLRRYLHCPACQGGGETGVFYAQNQDESSQGHVQDKARLIEDFSRLLVREDLADALPCIGCPETTKCFGPETMVLQRMQSLFFYPFYLIAQPAPTLNAVDFLALLSGATAKQAAGLLHPNEKPGRIARLRKLDRFATSGNGLLFGEDSRRLLEVLYLKLTFLGELATLVGQKRTGASEPEASVSLESLWVQLPLKSLRLPLFWNFSLDLIDHVGRPRPAMASPALERENLRQFYAKAWWFVLLANPQQGLDVILRAVEQHRNDENAAVERLLDPDSPLDPGFSPLHMLWNVPEWDPDPMLDSVWRQVLTLGLQLFNVSENEENDLPGATFTAQLDQVRQAVHQQLFMKIPVQAADAQSGQTPGAVPETVQTPAEADKSSDKAIASLLQTILRQWPASENMPLTDSGQVPQEAHEKSSMHANEDGDYEETIILRPSPADKSGKQASEEYEKTILQGAPSQTGGAQGWQADMEATVVVTPEPGHSNAAPGADILEKTVIMQPKAAPPSTAADDLEKTVVIQAPTPPHGQESNATPPAPRQGDAPPAVPADHTSAQYDDLAETVIINTEKAKKGKPGS